MARDDPQINIRMPAKLKARLEEAATSNNRSVTAEIVARLEQSMVGPKHPPNIVVRLEALPYGSEPAEISLGTFFENFSRTIKESVDAIKQARIDNRSQRAPDTLQPNLDTDDHDREIAETAAEQVRISIRERRVREAKNLARRHEERQRQEEDKPDE